MARRIVLQEPESGLDVFLKELSRYASPQYQLSLREQERADARLELSKRQMDENERRYQDSLRQQKFRNDRAIASEEIANERFQFNKRNSEYAIARQNIDDAFTGMNPRQAANMNIDSLVIGIEDPTVNLRSRKYAESLVKRGKQQFDRISSTLDIYNNQNPESPMTLDTALDVFRDDKSINEVFKSAYFSKGDLSPKERAQISTITPRLTSLRKQQADLLVQKASGVVGVDDALAEVIVNIDNLQGRLDSILQTSSTQIGDATIDAYSNRGAPEGDGGAPEGDEGIRKPPPVEEERTTAIPDFLLTDYTPGEMAGAFASDDMYNVLFSDEEDIVDSAVDMANRNASGEDVKDVVIGQGGEQEDAKTYTMNSAQEAVNSGDIKDLEDARSLGIPESIISGLSFTQADTDGRQTSPPPEDLDLFPRQEQGGGFSLQEPPAKLKDATFGIKDFRKLLKKLNRNSELLSQGVPNKTTEDNIRKANDKLRDELKEMFSKIYDKGSKSFYDDNLKRIEDNRRTFPSLKEKPLKYREFFTNEEFSLLKSL